ncbi:MAG: hypothetical protein ACXWBL_16075, partial [Usitatibacter sp.]
YRLTRTIPPIFHKEVDMDFKDQYPDFAKVEQLIRRARAERAVYLANVIANAIVAVGRGMRSLVSAGARRAADLRAIESDPFLKRSVPKY